VASLLGNLNDRNYQGENQIIKLAVLKYGNSMVVSYQKKN